MLVGQKLVPHQTKRAPSGIWQGDVTWRSMLIDYIMRKSTTLYRRLRPKPENRIPAVAMIAMRAITTNIDVQPNFSSRLSGLRCV
jgi:hypothetical protein